MGEGVKGGRRGWLRLLASSLAVAAGLGAAAALRSFIFGATCAGGSASCHRCLGGGERRLLAAHLLLERLDALLRRFVLRLQPLDELLVLRLLGLDLGLEPL